MLEQLFDANPNITLSEVNAKTIAIKDKTLIGPVGLRKRLPIEVVEAAAMSFEAAAKQSATMRMLVGTFQTYGFDFSDPDTIANIDALVAGGMPAEVGEALKSISTTMVSPAEQLLGVGTVVTQGEFDAAKSRYLAGKIRNQVAAQYNAVYQLLSSGQIAQAKLVWDQGSDLFE